VGGQLVSALIYLGGDHGKPEPYKAQVWADVAHTNGSNDALLVRDYASYKLDRKEIAQASEQAQACLKTGYRSSFAR
jgi:hypothetical protein